MENYSNILKDLHYYCSNENYMGYNLLDSHNSIIPFKKLGNPFSFYINQFFRRSPINLRPLVGIKKTTNPKAIGLFLNSYTKLKKLNLIDENILDELNNKFFNWLLNNNCKGYSGYCWGYHYDWPQRDGNTVPANTPCGVVTSFIIRAMFNYYNVYKNEKVKQIINSAALFVLKDLHLTETKHGLCFSYTTLKNDLTVNANLLAAEILAYDDYINDKEDHLHLIKGVLDFTTNLQNEDGSWYYSHQLNTFKPSKQIDFHQGYNVESMDIILKHSNVDRKLYNQVILKGLEFYKRKQFSSEGISYWRFPKKWPIDIHNQAQGIITLCHFSELDSSYLPFAKDIAYWTIQNMWSKKGYFYYQKWPIITNKISYMRWNQAWMMVALVDLLLSLKNKD